MCVVSVLVTFVMISGTHLLSLHNFDPPHLPALELLAERCWPWLGELLEEDALWHKACAPLCETPPPCCPALVAVLYKRAAEQPALLEALDAQTQRRFWDAVATGVTANPRHMQRTLRLEPTLVGLALDGLAIADSLAARLSLG